ncbi:AraC family transcriptional regulator [Silvimonas amylolytica]|uniref:Transcriptional regulator n=1 Tax=Silvimonas amylolytica TaxID=449663 RepID=A0ABQ2PMI4_9NEIS|nr:AraC family transcriptional regulator [Silvimonas amylolytica]GGP26493.1 transcriptional regulator [Silvimonas amylolytica]
MTASALPVNQRLSELILQLQPGYGISETSLPGVVLMRVNQDTPRIPVFYEPGIFVIAQGRKVGYLGEHCWQYDAHNYLVMSVPLPFECETQIHGAEPFLGVRIPVDVGLLRELLLQMETLPDSPPSEANPDIPMASVPLDVILDDAIIRLMHCLQNPLESHVLGPQLIREIVFRALQGSQGNALRAVAGRQGNFSRMARALRRMHTEYASALDIDTLAQEANMSVSAFHHNFKAMTFTSPLQYLKRVRLHKALLLMVQDGLNVSAAANRVGYESPSQFSREFKRCFGRSPVEEVGAALAQ